MNRWADDGGVGGMGWTHQQVDGCTGGCAEERTAGWVDGVKSTDLRKLHNKKTQENKCSRLIFSHLLPCQHKHPTCLNK